jgi:hypothetical protein
MLAILSSGMMSQGVLEELTDVQDRERRLSDEDWLDEKLVRRAFEKGRKRDRCSRNLESHPMGKGRCLRFSNRGDRTADNERERWVSYGGCWLQFAEQLLPRRETR